MTGHDLLILDGTFGRIPAMGWLWAQMGQAEVVLHTNEIAPLVAAMRAGGGIACLPVVAIEDMTGIRAIAPGIVGRFDIYLATHRDLRERARVRAVFDFIARLFAQRSAVLNGAAVGKLFAAPAINADGSDP